MKSHLSKYAGWPAHRAGRTSLILLPIMATTAGFLTAPLPPTASEVAPETHRADDWFAGLDERPAEGLKRLESTMRISSAPRLPKDRQATPGPRHPDRDGSRISAFEPTSLGGVARSRLYRKHAGRIPAALRTDPVVFAYPLFLLGLPLALRFPLYPFLLLIPAWRNRPIGPARAIVDHLIYGAGALAGALRR